MIFMPSQVDPRQPSKVVSVFPLDIVLHSDIPMKPDLIKIDVEGLECDVLAGATITLRKARPILLIDVDHGGSEYRRSIELLLRQYDYSLYTVCIPPTCLRSIPLVIKDILALPSERAESIISALVTNRSNG